MPVLLLFVILLWESAFGKHASYYARQRAETFPSAPSMKEKLTQEFVDLGVSTSNLPSFFASVRNAVVQVSSTIAEFSWELPWQVQRDTESLGSGFFVKLENRSFIVTNAHVVLNGVGIVVSLPNLGLETFPVEVAAICPGKDVALLQLTIKGDERLQALLTLHGEQINYLEFGNSDRFQQGDSAIAVGYPLGQKNSKISTGVFAGTEHVDSRFYLQMTTPINPGNSGGPLLNSRGLVMGINTAAIKDASNVGYALPSNHFKPMLHAFAQSALPPSFGVASLDSEEGSENEVAMLSESSSQKMKKYGPLTTMLSTKPPTTSSKKLKSKANVVKYFPRLGVELSPTSLYTGPYLGYLGEGVFVQKVAPFGFFERAGVKRGDLLVEFDGHPLDRFGRTTEANLEGLDIFDLAERIRYGKMVNLIVWRHPNILTLNATFGEDTENFAVRFFAEPLLEGVQYEVFAGIVIMELSLNLVQKFSDNSDLGRFLDDRNRIQARLAVTQVFQNTAVPENVLSSGDIIVTINGKKVSDLRSYREAFWTPNCFWTLETAEGALVVVPFDDALQSEEIVSTLFGYRPTEAVRNALKKGTNACNLDTQKNQGSLSSTRRNHFISPTPLPSPGPPSSPVLLVSPVPTPPVRGNQI